MMVWRAWTIGREQFLIVPGYLSFIILLMKCDIFVWNWQGAGNPKFYRFLKEYLRDFDPDVMVLVETRVSGIIAENAIKKIGFWKSHRVEARRFSGGIWVMCKDSVQVAVELNNFQFIQLKVKFPDLQDLVMFTGVYGSPHWVTRKELRADLGAIAKGVQILWLLAGDFNALLHDDKRQCGSPKGKYSCQLFQTFCNDYSLKDVGFQGSRFTWSRGSL